MSGICFKIVEQKRGKQRESIWSKRAKYWSLLYIADRCSGSIIVYMFEVFS